MLLSCLGSLHALEQTAKNAYWRKYLKRGKLPSADTLGRVFSVSDYNDIRNICWKVYSRLKRNKALRPFYGNSFGLIIDGHETTASYLSCCANCQQRKIETRNGEQIQYYHRLVMVMLLCGNMCLPLDVEPQRPGEDEVAAGMRLLKRVLVNYPRAFDFILADGLYLQQRLFRTALDAKKHVVVVLKDEQRELLKEAHRLFAREAPTRHQVGKTLHECWDNEGFLPWFDMGPGTLLRVVRSRETTTVRRQRSGQEESQTSEWLWATTIPQRLLPTVSFVQCAHRRWDIENKGFNELVNQWGFDHNYKHDITAMVNFWLMTMIAYSLFHAFFLLNLKPQARAKHTKLHFIRLLGADLFALKAKSPP